MREDIDNPTANWFLLQDVFYRKVKIYDMDWNDIYLPKYRVFPAPYGGPIAMIRNFGVLVEVESTEIMEGSIGVFKATGGKIGLIECEEIEIVGIGWNRKDEIVCVQSDGAVRIFGISGENRVFTLGIDPQLEGILECKFWESGLVAITTNFQIICVEDLWNPKPTVFMNTKLREKPNSWEVVPPYLTNSGHVEVYLSVGGTILIADISETQDQYLQQGPFTRMAISPNAKLIALYQPSGKLMVVSSDFQKSFSEIDLHEILGENIDSEEAEEDKCEISEIKWSGEDGVVVSFGNRVILAGPFGGTLEFEYESDVYLVQEIDGVRVFNQEVHEFIHKIPEPLLSVFQAGSTQPAALLFDAHQRLKNNSAKADEIVKSIGASLSQAVNTCIEAAGNEFEVELQQALLRAASYGKSFIVDHNPARFVEACNNLRILNSLRHGSIALCPTMVQYLSLTSFGWLEKLLERNLHFMGLQFCKHLKLGFDTVYIHWANAKIRNSTSDDDYLYSVLLNKLSEISGISYINIAETARVCGRQKLAAKLLQLETSASNKVPLLLSMSFHSLALKESISSGNVDLIYLVLFSLYNQLPLGDFFKLVSTNKFASLLFVKYCLNLNKLSVLKNFHFQEDDYFGSFLLHVLEVYNSPLENTEFISHFNSIISLLSKDPDMSLEHRELILQAKLLSLQCKLEADLTNAQLTVRYNNYTPTYLKSLPSLSSLNSSLNAYASKHGQHLSFVGLSLFQTITKLVLLKQYSLANSVKHDFNVADSSYYHLKLRALVKIRDFVELDKLSKAKNSPIGFKPFVDELTNAQQFQEAAKYIPFCKLSQRPPLYLKINFLNEAVEAAIAAKDIGTLRSIHEQSSDIVLKKEIEAILGTL